MKAARRLSSTAKPILRDRSVEKEEENEIRQSMKDNAESSQSTSSRVHIDHRTHTPSGFSSTGINHLAPLPKDPSISSRERRSPLPSRFLRRAALIAKPSGAPSDALRVALKGPGGSNSNQVDNDDTDSLNSPHSPLRRRITVDIPRSLKAAVKKGAVNLSRSRTSKEGSISEVKSKGHKHKRAVSDTLGLLKPPELILYSQSEPLTVSSPITESSIATSFDPRRSAPVIVTTQTNTMSDFHPQRNDTIGSESIPGTSTVDPSDDGNEVQDAGAPSRPSDSIDFFDEIKVPALLQQGTPMLEITAKEAKLRKFRLDPDQGLLLWESRTAGLISIENIREMRAGVHARNYREQFKIAADSEPCWLTIIYILNGKYKTLHVIALSQDVFQMWHNTLTKLYSLREELMKGLGNMERRQMIWEKQYWKGADVNGDSKLDFSEVERMCRRLNIHTSNDDIYKKFQEADSSNKGYLNFPDFQKFVKLLKSRLEVRRLYMKYAGGETGKFNFEVFQKFMREAQKSDMSQAQLKRIFDKYTIHPDSAASNALKLEPTPQGPIPTVDPKVLKHGPPIVASSPGGTSIVPEELSALSPSSLTSTDSAADGSLKGLVGAAIESATHLSPSIVSPLPTPKPEVEMTIDQFTGFLFSADNDPFMDHHSEIYHDMSRPLADYYISSSHNTYLVGNQVIGDSTFEGYIRALLQGCRSVELDIWDGDQEPVIYRGRTLTSKVSVREVIRAIAKYAFVASPFPVIISAEIHCNLKQQDMVARIMKDSFGEALVTDYLPSRWDTKSMHGVKELPSPEELKGRILLNAKNLYVAETVEIQPKGVVVDTESSNTEASTSSFESEGGPISKPRALLEKLRGKAPRLLGTASSPPSSAALARTGGTTATALGDKPKVKMSMDLVALLIYTVGVECRGFNKKEHYEPTHLFSLSERTANTMLKQNIVDLIKHNRTHVVRIYPNNTRLRLANVEPHRYWAAGAQLVALNWQTSDLGYMINYAMFQRNGKSGYVLKPAALRVRDRSSLVRTEHFLDVTIISAQQLPRPKDETGRELFDKSIVNPFVTVSVHVPDWSYSPLMPEEQVRSVNYLPETYAKKYPVSGFTSGSASTTRTVSVRTGVVKNNGFNPVWEEKLSLPFDLLGRMKDLVFVRFEVREEDSDQEHPVAVYCINLGCLMMGYRHLPLHDQHMSQYLFSTLFVKVNIRDA